MEGTMGCDAIIRQYVEQHRQEILQQAIQQDEVFEEIPIINRETIYAFNAFLFDVHHQNHENGHRWASEINERLSDMLTNNKREYFG